MWLATHKMVGGEEHSNILCWGARENVSRSFFSVCEFSTIQSQIKQWLVIIIYRGSYEHHIMCWDNTYWLSILTSITFIQCEISSLNQLNFLCVNITKVVPSIAFKLSLLSLKMIKLLSNWDIIISLWITMEISLLSLKSNMKVTECSSLLHMGVNSIKISSFFFFFSLFLQPNLLEKWIISLSSGRYYNLHFRN